MINKVRLTELADLLRDLAHTNPDHFVTPSKTKSGWNRFNEVPTIFDLNSFFNHKWEAGERCGTTACAAGFAAVYKPFRAQGLHTIDDVQAFFGLTDVQFDFLFAPGSYGKDKSKRTVIRRIKSLIAHDGVIINFAARKRNAAHPLRHVFAP